MTKKLVAVAVVVLAACGQGGGRSVDVRGMLASDRTTLPAATGLGPTAGTDGAEASNPGGSAAGSTGTTGHRAGSASNGVGAGGVGRSGAIASGPTAQGVTATTIKIGVYHYDQASATAAMAAFGASGGSVGDTKAFAQAVIDDINAHGGMAGRKVEPVFFAQDATKQVNGGAAAQAQAACAHFTQDNQVFAVVQPIGGPVDVLVPCLAARNTPLVLASLAPVDDVLLRQFPGFLYLPSAASITRAAGFTVDALAAQGFYASGAKIGLVRSDLPVTARATTQGLKPALARHGLKLTDEAAVTFPNEQQFASAVLRFKADGITHVQFMDQTGTIAMTFMNTAESQGYRPRYAVNSDSAPRMQTANAPAAQLRGALGVGWIPTIDVGASEEQGRTPAARHCLDIMSKAGVATPDRFAESFALWSCDALQFLDEAVDASAQLTPVGLRSAVEALGDRFAPAGTFAAKFGAGRHDGVNVSHDLAFDDRCTCFRYTGAVRPAP